MSEEEETKYFGINGPEGQKSSPAASAAAAASRNLQLASMTRREKVSKKKEEEEEARAGPEESTAPRRCENEDQRLFCHGGLSGSAHQREAGTAARGAGNRLPQRGGGVPAAGT